MAGSKLQKRRKGEPKARLSNLLSPSLKCLPADSKQTFETSAHGRLAHIFRRDKQATSTTTTHGANPERRFIWVSRERPGTITPDAPFDGFGLDASKKVARRAKIHHFFSSLVRPASHMTPIDPKKATESAVRTRDRDIRPFETSHNAPVAEDEHLASAVTSLIAYRGPLPFALQREFEDSERSVKIISNHGIASSYEEARPSSTASVSKQDACNALATDGALPLVLSDVTGESGTEAVASPFGINFVPLPARDRMIRSMFPGHQLPQHLVNRATFEADFPREQSTLTQDDGSCPALQPRRLSTPGNIDGVTCIFTSPVNSRRFSDCEPIYSRVASDTSTLVDVGQLQRAVDTDAPEPEEPKTHTDAEVDAIIVAKDQERIDDLAALQDEHNDNMKYAKQDLDAEKSKCYQASKKHDAMSRECVGLGNVNSQVQHQLDSFRESVAQEMGTVMRLFDPEARNPSGGSVSVLGDLRVMRQRANQILEAFQNKETQYRDTIADLYRSNNGLQQAREEVEITNRQIMAQWGTAMDSFYESRDLGKNLQTQIDRLKNQLADQNAELGKAQVEQKETLDRLERVRFQLFAKIKFLQEKDRQFNTQQKRHGEEIERRNHLAEELAALEQKRQLEAQTAKEEALDAAKGLEHAQSEVDILKYENDMLREEQRIWHAILKKKFYANDLAVHQAEALGRWFAQHGKQETRLLNKNSEVAQLERQVRGREYDILQLQTTLKAKNVEIKREKQATQHADELRFSAELEANGKEHERESWITEIRQLQNQGHDLREELQRQRKHADEWQQLAADLNHQHVEAQGLLNAQPWMVHDLREVVAERDVEILVLKEETRVLNEEIREKDVDLGVMEDQRDSERGYNSAFILSAQRKIAERNDYLARLLAMEERFAKELHREPLEYTNNAPDFDETKPDDWDERYRAAFRHYYGHNPPVREIVGSQGELAFGRYDDKIVHLYGTKPDEELMARVEAATADGENDAAYAEESSAWSDTSSEMEDEDTSDNFVTPFRTVEADGTVTMTFRKSVDRIGELRREMLDG